MLANSPRFLAKRRPRGPRHIPANGDLNPLLPSLGKFDRVLRKRALALREFALGIDALERFVRGEPLRGVHECVFGVLALDSEPVDPASRPARLEPACSAACRLRVGDLSVSGQFRLSLFGGRKGFSI